MPGGFTTHRAERQAGGCFPASWASYMRTSIDSSWASTDAALSSRAASRAVKPGAREIRSLVVARSGEAKARRRVVEELRQRARADGFVICACSPIRPAYFAHMGFSLVPTRAAGEDLGRLPELCPVPAGANNTRWSRTSSRCGARLTLRITRSMSKAAIGRDCEAHRVDGGVPAAGFKRRVVRGHQTGDACVAADVMLLVADSVVGGCVFTTNQTQAAPSCCRVRTGALRRKGPGGGLQQRLRQRLHRRRRVRSVARTGEFVARQVDAGRRKCSSHLPVYRRDLVLAKVNAASPEPRPCSAGATARRGACDHDNRSVSKRDGRRVETVSEPSMLEA